jgi:hypothetical protein
MTRCFLITIRDAGDDEPDAMSVKDALVNERLSGRHTEVDVEQVNIKRKPGRIEILSVEDAA